MTTEQALKEIDYLSSYIDYRIENAVSPYEVRYMCSEVGVVDSMDDYEIIRVDLYKGEKIFVDVESHGQTYGKLTFEEFKERGLHLR